MTTASPDRESEEVRVLVVDAFGIAVAVRPPDLVSRDRWTRQWARALSTRPAGAADTTLDAGAAPPGQPPEIADYALTSRITRAALEQTAGVRMGLHGAALADPAGRVLALVAASGMGKTTASRELGRVLGYLSDETVSVGKDLDVLPYAKPLSVVIDPANPHHKEQLSPDDLGLLRHTGAAHMHRLVFLDRGDGDERGLGRMPLAEALSWLVPQTSYLASWKSPLLDLATLMLACGGPWRLRYTEIADHVEDLLALMRGSAEDAGESVPLVHHPLAAAGTPVSAASVARRPWHDAVEVDGALVVLIGHTSFQLGELGATIWLALKRPRTDAELVAAAEEAHGRHPDSIRLVREALAELEESGIVVRGEKS